MAPFYPGYLAPFQKDGQTYGIPKDSSVLGMQTNDKLLGDAGVAIPTTLEELEAAARTLKDKGATGLRGGAFKPRTSPYSFQGLGVEGLKLLAEAREQTGLPIITEIMDTKDLEVIEKYADCLQVGARNMQNFSLLRRVGPHARGPRAARRWPVRRRRRHRARPRTA